MKIFGFEIPFLISPKEKRKLFESAKAVEELLLERTINNIQEEAKFQTKLAGIKETIPGAGYIVTAALSSIYTRVQLLRKEIIQQIDRIRNFYITDVLLSQFSDDALTPDVASGEVLSVYSERPDLDYELKALEDRLQFDKLVSDIVEDLLAYGEYTLEVEVEPGFGIKKLKDEVDQTSVIAITELGEISNYLVMDSKGSKAELVEPSRYIKFMLGNRRVRIDLRNELQYLKDKKIMGEIPRFVRIGKSLLFPILSKVKELELLEQLVPASKLAQLTANTLIGVNVPGGIEPQKAFEVARNIENLVNRKVGIDFGNRELTIQNIMTIAGRIKIIPIFGGDRGDLKKIEYRAEEPTDLMAVAEDARKVICSSVGIPYELIFSGSELKRVDLLKRYARYLRRLKMIQKAIAEGIRQICNIHLVNKNFSYRPSDISIDFKNILINVDELDKLEFTDATVSMLKNINEFMAGLTDEMQSKCVDKKEWYEFLNNQLSIAGMSNIIDSELAEEDLVDKEMERIPVGIAEPVGLEEPEEPETPEETLGEEPPPKAPPVATAP